MSKAKMNSGDDYEVGYGRPPKATRFQPGHSGNPRGRPRKPATVGALLDQELNRKIAINEDGVVRKVTKIDLLIRRLITDAIKGDLRASRLILELRRAGDDAAENEALTQAAETLTAAERETLTRHFAEMAAQVATAGDDEGEG